LNPPLEQVDLTAYCLREMVGVWGLTSLYMTKMISDKREMVLLRRTDIWTIRKPPREVTSWLSSGSSIRPLLVAVKAGEQWPVNLRIR